jgi:hypothetical protein
MRNCLLVGLLSLVLAAAGSLRAEDAAKPDEKAAPAAGEPKKAEDKTVAAAEPKAAETKRGTLSEKPANAPDGVVAVLTVGGGDAQADKKAEKKAAKHGGKKGDGAPAAKEEKFNLIATGDIATKVTDLAKKGATADVVGVVNSDTMTIKVTDATEAAATDHGKHGKKNK